MVFGSLEKHVFGRRGQLLAGQTVDRTDQAERRVTERDAWNLRRVADAASRSTATRRPRDTQEELVTRRCLTSMHRTQP